MALAPEAQALEMMVDRAWKPEGVAQIDALLLHQIMRDARGLVLETIAASRRAWRRYSWPSAHFAAGRAQNQRQMFSRRPAALRPGLVRGQQQQSRGAIEPPQLAADNRVGGQIFRQINFRRDFGALPRDVEQRHRAEGGFARREIPRRLFSSRSPAR